MENLFTDEYFMRIAFNEAVTAYERDEIPVGAVIVCNNKIIAKAHNLTETLTDVTAHAEMQAITSAANYLGGKYLFQVNCEALGTASIVEIFITTDANGAVHFNQTSVGSCTTTFSASILGNIVSISSVSPSADPVDYKYCATMFVT